MKNALLSLLPSPYNINDLTLKAEISAEANVLTKIELSAKTVAQAVTPLDLNLLNCWEQLLEIEPPEAATGQQRLELIKGKINSTGGLSRGYFIRLAQALGYHIDIIEPQQFIAGINRAGDVVYGEDIHYCWFVVVHNLKIKRYQFRANSSAGECLLSFGDDRLEVVFNDLKPAHTHVGFKYIGIGE